MNDILKTLKTLDKIDSKKTLTETAVGECGDMGAMASPAPVNQGNPVTASVTLNASGMDHVGDLMRLLQQAGLEQAGPVAAPTMPMRTDMENLRDKMNGLEGPPSEPKPQYFDTDDVTGGGDDMHREKDPAEIRVKDGSLADDIEHSEIEEWENEPDEEHGDHLELIKRLAGGINGEKKMHKVASQGDNAMTLENKEVDPEVLARLQKISSIKNVELLKQETIKMLNDTKMEPKKKVSLIQNAKNSRTVKNLIGILWNTFVLGKENLHALDSDWRVRHESEEQDKVEETIKSRLLKALSEKKEAKKTKPDFLKKKTDDKKSSKKDTKRKKTNESAGSLDDSIKKIYGKIYNYGDAGLDYLDSNAPFYDNLASMHDGDLDQILANISDQEKMKLGRELKSVLDSMSFNLESEVSEISPNLAKRYTKAAKMDRDFNDDDLGKLPNKVRHGTDDQARQASADMMKLQRRNSKRQTGINRAAKRM